MHSLTNCLKKPRTRKTHQSQQIWHSKRNSGIPKDIPKCYFCFHLPVSLPDWKGQLLLHLLPIHRWNLVSLMIMITCLHDTKMKQQYPIVSTSIINTQSQRLKTDPLVSCVMDYCVKFCRN